MASAPSQAGAVEGQSRSLEQHVAGERVPVAPESGRRQTDQHVAGADPGRPEDPLLVDDAHGESHQVELARLHDAGVLGHLPAQQRGPHLAAPLGHPGHEVGHAGGLDGPGRDVVEEEERLGALAHEVVDAHGHQVHTDGVEAAHLLGHHQLGADAVGRRHQDGPVVAGRFQPEQAPEVAEAADHLGASRRGHHRLDQVDRTLAGVDVDPGPGIGGRSMGGRSGGARHAVGQAGAGATVAVTVGRSVIATATCWTGTG